MSDEADDDADGRRSDPDDDEFGRLKSEVDDFAARLLIFGVALIVVGVVIVAYVFAAHATR
jgi:hypothetical protein